jgi:ligand-binding sensor domain-containing protein
MNSNNINDIYIDEEKRIWIANYPEGITIIDNRDGWGNLTLCFLLLIYNA